MCAPGRTVANGWSVCANRWFGWLAGYEDVNDAERLRRDPAMRWVVGDRAITRSAASASQMGRFKARWRRRPGNLAALADLPGQSIDKVHQRRPPKRIVLDMDSEPNLWREGNVPNGQRWRCVATDVRRHPVADRPAPGTTRASMRGAVRFATGDSGGGGAPSCRHISTVQRSGASTAGFDRLLPVLGAICHCPSHSKARSWRRNCRESGECRLRTLHPAAGYDFAMSVSAWARRREHTANVARLSKPAEKGRRARRQK